MILLGIFHVVLCFPLHSMFYRKNLDCFSNRVRVMGGSLNIVLASCVTFTRSSLTNPLDTNFFLGADLPSTVGRALP